MEMEEFEQLWAAMQDAFSRNGKPEAIKLIRGVAPQTVGLMGAKKYIELFWHKGDLEAMRNDLVAQLGLNPGQEKPATQPLRIVQNENFSLAVKKEGVSWDDWNEFFDYVSRELGL